MHYLMVAASAVRKAAQKMRAGFSKLRQKVRAVVAALWE